MKDKKQEPTALLLFFFSGLLSLILQVVWLKKLVLVFGNTVWAVSTLLTAFMAGLALGSWLFGRIADRSDSPLKVKNYLVNLKNATERREDIMARLDRYETATIYNLTGQLLFREGKRLEAFEQFNMIPMSNPEDLEPVEYFGASYQTPFLKNAAIPKE